MMCCVCVCVCVCVCGPVAAGDDDAVLGGECVGGQTLDVPVPHGGGPGQEAGETEARGARHL